jgi:hypothetical protein
MSARRRCPDVFTRAIRQLEAARTGTPRIEKQDAIPRFDRGPMGMPEHHRRKTRGRRVDVKLR